MPLKVNQVLLALLVAVLGAPRMVTAQQNQAAEIAQLRSELQRALVRIEMLERHVLAAPAPGRSAPPQPASANQPRSLMTPSAVDAPPEDVAPARRSAPSSGGYTRGPIGGFYTYSASGRKRYVDRSFCQ